jgi:PAS domain S-box-containing protein
MQSSDASKNQEVAGRNVRDAGQKRAVTSVEAMTSKTTAGSFKVQARLESILRAAPIGIGVVLDRVLVEVNDRFCEMTGYSRDELIGRSSRMVYPSQEDYDFVGRVKYEQIRQSGTGTVETRWRRKDGKIIDILLSSSALDRTDLSKGVTFTAIDVTASREAQRSLAQSERLLQDAEEIAHVGSFRRDFKTQAITWSTETYRIFGYEMGEITPSIRFLMDHIHPDDRDRFIEVSGILTGTGKGYDVTYRIIRKDGLARIVRSKTSVQHDRTGAAVRLVGAIQDITEQTQAEQRLHILHDLGVALSSIGDLKAALDHLIEAVCHLEEIDCGGVYLVDPTTGDLDLTAHYGLSSDFVEKISQYRADAPNARIVMIGQPIYRPFSQVRPFEEAYLDREGLHALAVIPILHNDEVVASLNLASHTRHNLSSDTRLTLEAIAAEIGGTVARIRAEQAMRESEDKFKTLADESLDSIVIHDGTTILEANKTFAKMWGYEPRETVGLQVGQCIAEESLVVVRENIRSGYELAYEVVGIHKDGTRFPAEITGKPIAYKGRTVRIATARDITQRKLAEEALRESEAQFRAIAALSPAAIAILRSNEEDERILYVNAAWQALTGYSETEAASLKPKDLAHPDIRAQVAQRAALRLQGEQVPARYEGKIVIKSGETRYLDLAATVIQYQGLPAILAVALDVTDRKCAEEALSAASRQWQSTFDSVSDVIWVLDREFRIRQSNKATTRMFGQRWDEILGKHCWEVVHGTTEPIPECPVLRMRQTLTRESVVISIGPRWYEVTVDPILDAAGVLDGTVHVVSDITSRKKTEEDLLAQRMKLRSLAFELSLTEERERQRIAANLHDHACQSLALAKMKLQAMLKAVQRREARALADICDTLNQTIENIRELTFDLSSATLYKFGLEAAVEELLRDKLIGQDQIRYQFLTDGTPKPLTQDVCVLLFQSVRELLINAVKHACAKKVTVESRRRDDSIQITIADDGVGFDVEEAWTSADRSRSVGLFYVRERLDYIGGRLQIDSRPGHGSRFTLTAPLNLSSQETKENSHGCEDSAGR